MPYIDFRQLEKLEAANKPGPAISWRSAARSDVGRVRQLNEDAFLNAAAQGLWAVADGMGGLARGDYASSAVVEALVHYASSQSLASNIRDLEVRLRAAHDNCRHAFGGERVGSTVAVLFSHGPYVFLLWAGDSRIYRYREGKLEQMTSDHTVAQGKCDEGEFTAAQAKRHVFANVLTRAVGVHQTLYLDLHYDTVQPGDRYLICSDGLYNPLGLGDMLSKMACHSAQQALNGLVDLALARGGGDNITAIVVDAMDSSDPE